MYEPGVTRARPAPHTAVAASTTVAAFTSVTAALALLTGCGNVTPSPDRASSAPSAHERTYRQLPGVGEHLRSEIPDGTRQAVVVYGKDARSADSTVVLFRRSEGRWQRDREWAAHNGRGGWTTDHREGDKKSPVGVFTLSDAGGVLPDPGAKLPYDASSAFTPPSYWSKNTRHDFDHVIAVDYNRVRGTSPIDPRRPDGAAKGGGIWLHLDHGSGTSACVSLSASGMRYLLRTLDPALHPVVVMGDRAALKA